MGIPALWAGGEPSRIVSTLIVSLLEMLRLTFVFVRLNDPDVGYDDVNAPAMLANP